MKKILIALMIIVSGCHVSRQAVVISSSRNNDSVTSPKKLSDTTAYLKSIIDNKGKFIGQPLEYLLVSLKIDVKHYTPFTQKSMTELTGIAILFHPEKEYNALYDISKNVNFLNIVFLEEVSSNQAIKLYKKNHFWTIEEREYYGKQIVKDIVLPGYVSK